jgi:hypothetical protein
VRLRWLFSARCARLGATLAQFAGDALTNGAFPDDAFAGVTPRGTTLKGTVLIMLAGIPFDTALGRAPIGRTPTIVSTRAAEYNASINARGCSITSFQVPYPGTSTISRELAAVE